MFKSIVLVFSVIAFILLLVFIFYHNRLLRPSQMKEFPLIWESLLQEHVQYYRELTPERQLVFRERILQFLNRVYIKGVGTEVEDLDKVLVASSAVIPVFQFPTFNYKNLNTVLLYPNVFNENLDFSSHAKDKKISGLVGNGRFEKQMILSKQSLRAGFAPTTERYNTGIHEFVHLIDKLDGKTDGIPEVLMQHAYTIPWLKLIHYKIRRIKNRKSDINPYGATNEAEFFAVAAEYFFEKPEKMQKEHPELYNMLNTFFKVK